ncbi:MAG: hypothetical protein IT333_01535 [Thermomicrobiales bacterium]|jgi:hypothetical protein|nr:hypothetical protein [Thermomicrobiales bacterium]
MTDEREKAMIERWKAATKSAGISISDEDIQRTAERGFLSRALAVEQMIDDIVTGVEIPDYLDPIVSTPSKEASRG